MRFDTSADGVNAPLPFLSLLHSWSRVVIAQSRARTAEPACAGNQDGQFLLRCELSDVPT